MLADINGPMYSFAYTVAYTPMERALSARALLFALRQCRCQRLRCSLL